MAWQTSGRHGSSLARARFFAMLAGDGDRGDGNERDLAAGGLSPAQLRQTALWRHRPTRPRQQRGLLDPVRDWPDGSAGRRTRSGLATSHRLRHRPGGNRLHPRDIGTRVVAVGRSSIRLEQTLFQGEARVAAAESVLVLIDETTRRSCPLPPDGMAYFSGLIG